MNVSVFSPQNLCVPVADVFTNLTRLTRAAAVGWYGHYQFGAPRRMLANLVSTFFMAGCPLIAQNFAPTSAPAQNWVSLTASADGSHVVAAGSYGYLYVSADSGTSWALATTGPGGVEPERAWESVAISADGRQLVAAANSSPLFLSTNYGETWTTNGPALNWAAVASSADGLKLVAADYGLTGIYSSSDAGRTWARTSAPARRWRSVACSADGMRLLAGADCGPDYATPAGLYVSADSGATWRLSGAPSQPYEAIASSADGTRLAAAVYGGLIYLSSDAGAHWTAADVPAMRWGGICCSGHGNKLVAAAWEGQLFYSADSGQTWTATTAPDAQWQTVTCSFDGSKAFAGVWNIWDDAPAGIYAANLLSPVSGTNGTALGPVLDLKVTGGTAVLTWPATATMFQLQQNSGLAAADWIDVPALPQSVNGANQVVLPFQAGNQFFRLVAR